MQPAQRVLLLVLPIAFIPFVLNFPAGLMLYWLTTNLWTTGQGIVTRRLVPKTATAAEEELADAAEGDDATANGAKPAPKPRRPRRDAAARAQGEAEEGRRRGE